MKTAIQLIAKERNEQIKKHGRSIEDDAVENSYGQLIDGAINLMKEEFNDRKKPYRWDKKIWEKMRAKPPLQRYIIAGALIAAQIDVDNYLKEENKKNL